MSITFRLVLAALLFSAAGAYGEPLCFDEAGAMYAIHPDILRAIAKVESNYQVRAINWNRNGTYDFGVMQINSNWAYALGMERWKTLGDSCSNIKTGAMILSGCMKKYGYTWDAIGCYNSQTPDKRDKYARMVYRQLQSIQRDERKHKEAVDADRAEADSNEAAGFHEADAVHEAPVRQPREATSRVPGPPPDESGVAFNSPSLRTGGTTGL
jgi:soluble lytic murein transglycosylase-like protein